MILERPWLKLAVGLLWLVGCGGAGGDECTPGTESCECAELSQCLPGLQCLSNFCVQVGTTQNPTNDPTSDPTSNPTSTPTNDPTNDPTETSATDPSPTSGPSPECPGGQVKCGDGCFDLSGDAAHCGDCGSACGPGEVCQDAECTMVANCTPMSCPGLSYCQLETKQCTPGCQFSAQCGDGEACDTINHVCVCAEGFQDKNGVCAACDEPTACGDACEPCPAVPNGHPICVDGKCKPVCDGEFTECGGDCFPNFPPICDEKRFSCTPCYVSEPHSVECEGSPSKCSIICAPGTVECGDSNYCAKGKNAPCNAHSECCSNDCAYNGFNYPTCREL